ncbi:MULTISPECIES: DUF4190 domain-containing protein [Cytobacillus]|uniref:DUF4190 domain-containing protein n=1 Tax=Cytobacillus TaxID=2675230 RepID=UPI001CD48D7F|nr:DUF4190 domain-containing protein [Cytobacillus kochii]MCA1028061.1 DUF4190 domain-containing protein [Cytobacillus kochii]MCM3323972.1 DUF4190 domain-containing protein [Cytobacillus kochii]MCM3346369.1 DUF4190 domain-containing protein [Cytobacillus kochii]MDM5205772.1 DUF4190 domain-containing protein [Cytobacillus kochii]MDQ0185586.1 hypothetical protein [Cytobacillus kochii]
MEQQKTNTKAVVSLTLGILSLLVPFIGFLLGIISIVFGRLSAKEILQTGEKGKSLATAGLICGIIGIILTVIWILFALLGIFAFSTFETEIQEMP